MKHPVKTHHLLFLILGTGIVGLLLRFWLFKTGVDAKGLLVTGHIADILVFILTAIVMLVLLLCSLSLGNTPSYTQMFPPSKIAFFGNLAAAAGILISAILELSRDFRSLTLFSLIAGLAAAASLVYLAFSRQKKQQPSMLFHCIFTFHLTLHVLAQYPVWSTQVQLQNYFFTLMASVFTLLAAYHRTAIDARSGNRRWYVFTNQAALFFCILCVRGESWLFYLSIAIWNGTNYCSLRTGKRSHRLNNTPMQLPEDVLLCIRTLEKAGYSAYVVGGCVRDSLLGITPNDYDLCTSANPEQICQVFTDYELVRSGEKHGTIGVVLNGKLYEITTFRTEGNYTDGRHPDCVEFVPKLEEDLQRRDFTINAIAYAPGKGFIDPWNGKKDLEQLILRAVGNPDIRFMEDSLRILRGVRFAVRFGMSVDPDTLAAMERLAPKMDRLARERVYEELCKLLPMMKAADLLRYAPVLTCAIPELAPMVNFDQCSPHHAYDVYTHTAHVVEAVSDEHALRWAALLHDTGKVATFTLDESGRGHFYGHAKISADMADTILHRLRAPTALREQVVFLIANHMLPMQPDKKQLRRRLGEFGVENVKLLLQLQKADQAGKGVDEPADISLAETQAVLEDILREKDCLSVKDLAITGRDILALGIAPGPEIGRCMTFLLHEVQDEILANEKQALLDAAEMFLKQ